MSAHIASRRRRRILMATSSTAALLIPLAACSSGSESAPPPTAVRTTYLSSGANDSGANDSGRPGTSTPQQEPAVDDSTPAVEPEGSGPAVVPAPDTPAPATSPGCHDRSAADAINASIGQMPTFNGNAWTPYDNNYDTCSDLTYAELALAGGTGGSPWQLMLFHQGQFLGRGTKCNLPFQHVTGTTPSSVTVTYRYLAPGDIDANPTQSATVTYAWTGSGVQMQGSLPAAVTQGKC